MCLSWIRTAVFGAGCVVFGLAVAPLFWSAVFVRPWRRHVIRKWLRRLRRF